MRVAIMQPTFLPWAGYINMIGTCDKFIFLDDVQVSPKSFQVRNRIPCEDGSFRWIGLKEDTSLPLANRLLNATGVKFPERDLQKIRRVLEDYYPSSRELDTLLVALELAFVQKGSIADLNISLLSSIFELMEIPFNYSLSSNSGIKGHGSKRIVDLLKSMKCSEYIVAPGSTDYMVGEEIWASVEFECSVYKYYPSAYSQRNQSDFVSHMSSIDIFLELGVERAKKNIFNSNFELIPFLSSF